MTETTVIKTLKAQPLYNRKGKVIGAKFQTQSTALEPNVQYVVTITKITKP